MTVNFINLIISWMLVCLIWLIQLVHYPTFSFIHADDFHAFHQHHTSSIVWMVIPLMLGELGLSFYLAYASGWEMPYLIPFIIVILLWLSTFLIQIPIHDSLSNGKDLEQIRRLVNTNWIRTFLWTLKGVWVAYFFLRV